MPELHFAIGGPGVDTTSVDNAALALEDKSFFIRRVGSDGFQIRHQPTLKKVVSDRKASLDPETEVKPTMRSITEKEFRSGASMPIVAFPAESSEVSDSPRLTLILMDPEAKWTGSGTIREQTAEWTRQHGTALRLYPGSLVWCFRKEGHDFRNKVENWLAWQRVSREVAEGILGSDLGQAEKAEIQTKLTVAESDAKDEVWASYRFVVIAENNEGDGLRVIDLGAGHSSGPETLCGRIMTALKFEGLLNENVGATYFDTKWPPALEASGAWPLQGLRKAFLDGSLTRLPDVDMILRRQIASFVERGDFGLASGLDTGGTYQRIWFREILPAEEISFDANVFLLTKAKAETVKGGVAEPGGDQGGPPLVLTSEPEVPTEKPVDGPAEGASTPQVGTLRLTGVIPSELWNRLGTKVLPKLRSCDDLRIEVGFSVSVLTDAIPALEAELRQALDDLGIGDKVHIERG